LTLGIGPLMELPALSVIVNILKKWNTERQNKTHLRILVAGTLLFIFLGLVTR
jgi:hypothetical protein